MNLRDKLLVGPVVMLSAQSQAAVDVVGFTIDGASPPYGLIMAGVLLLLIGLASLRRA